MEYKNGVADATRRAEVTKVFLINLQQPQSSSVYHSELPSLSLLLRSFIL